MECTCARQGSQQLHCPKGKPGPAPSMIKATVQRLLLHTLRLCKPLNASSSTDMPTSSAASLQLPLVRQHQPAQCSTRASASKHAGPGEAPHREAPRGSCCVLQGIRWRRGQRRDSSKQAMDTITSWCVHHAEAPHGRATRSGGLLLLHGPPLVLPKQPLCATWNSW